MALAPGARNGRTVLEIARLVLTSKEERKVGAAHVLQAAGSGGGAGDGATKKAIAAEWLTTLLMFGEKPAKGIEEEGRQHGVSWASIRRAADEMKIQKRRSGFGPGSVVYWRLPDEHPVLKLAAARRAKEEEASLSDEEFEAGLEALLGGENDGDDA